MFDNYRNILKKLTEETDDIEQTIYYAILEEIRSIKNQPGIHEQAKILIDATCDIAYESADPQDLSRIINAIIEIDKLIESKDQNAVPLIMNKEDMPVLEKIPPNNDETKEIKKDNEILPEQITVEKREEADKQEENGEGRNYAFNKEDIIEKVDNVLIYGFIVEEIMDRISDETTPQEMNEAIWEIYKDHDREISRGSAKAYRQKYEKFLEREGYLIRLNPNQDSNNIIRKYKKAKPGEDDSKKKEEIKQFIIEWGKKHNRTIRSMGVLASAKVSSDIDVRLNDITDSLNELEKEGKIIKRVETRTDSDDKKIYYELQ